MPRPKKSADPERIAADNDLLNQVAIGFGSKSDRDLAKRLGIPQSTMSKVRRNEVELAWHHRVVLMDKLGFLAVRRALNSVVPEVLSRRVDQFTNSVFQKITSGRLERELQHEEANLINFIDSFPPLQDNPVFKRLCGLSDQDKDALRNGAALTSMQRAQLLQALHVTDAKFWNIDWSKLSIMLESTSALLDEIERLAFPLDQHAEMNCVLIESLEQKFGGTNNLAQLLELAPSQVSQIKSGDANISLRTRLKILAEVERSGDGEMLDFGDLDRLAADPALIRERYHSGMLD